MLLLVSPPAPAAATPAAESCSQVAWVASACQHMASMLARIKLLSSAGGCDWYPCVRCQKPAALLRQAIGVAQQRPVGSTSLGLARRRAPAKLCPC